MSKHTPGPWTLAHERPLFGVWHVRQDPKDWDGQGYQAVATIPASKKGTYYGEMFQANAHLIAAAPDFYSAFCDGKPSVRDKIAEEIRRGGGIFSDAELAAIDAAIAKAEGGAI